MYILSPALLFLLTVSLELLVKFCFLDATGLVYKEYSAMTFALKTAFVCSADYLLSVVIHHRTNTRVEDRKR